MKNEVAEYEGIFTNQIPELYAFMEMDVLNTKIVFKKLIFLQFCVCILKKILL